ncbi:FAST kinase domain-containing protein 1, mitochondrial isoform X1 [Drosophila albomicans]|uniref:FAST kinase domain-containing protein 1, mitochondrial isoform X1 n=1 Tax=Drosophila albomicans TaxID=7291 RepID=A0A6P8WKV8_DROAB|nr:FAST kinase domain-containing protein 1, mitochondrial isoform X1 [Drosophila albomicans]XP_051858747.1 FAST kinase domain-containing protein 1, mitochondrial isoform X1 [Drosophila albomicans]
MKVFIIYMFFNYLPRTNCNSLQYMVQMHQVLLRRQYAYSGIMPPSQVWYDLLRFPRSKKLVHLYDVCPSYIVKSRTIRQNRVFNGMDELGNGEIKNISYTTNFKMNTAQSVHEILDSMSQHSQQIEYQVQAILMLWSYYQRLPNTARPLLTKQLNKKIVPHLLSQIPNMDINELSVCYLYLRKMHVPNSDGTLQSILSRGLKLIELAVGKDLIPLQALSRLLVGINLERDFFTPLVCQHFKPHLEQHIADCQSEYQVRLVSTCLFQLHGLIHQELLDVYKHRVNELLQRGILNSGTPKALLKLLHMLNLPVWSNQNTTLIRQLMLQLRNCICTRQLEPNDLKSVCRTFLHHQEPAELMQPLKEATESLLQQESSADALSCAVPFMDLEQRDDYVRQFRKLLKSKSAWEQPNASGHFFSVLRALKIADVRDCDAYWAAVIRTLQTCSKEQTNLPFLRHCQRYMNFNNNLGGTYRHLEFERVVSRLCLDAIENSLTGRLPSKFAHMAAFVMAYGHTPFAWKKFPNILLSKLLAMMPQFNIQDCFLISRGIQIACELRFRHHVPSILGMQLSTIDSILIACSERHLLASEETSQPLKATDLNIIVRTLSHRKSLKNTQVYNLALERYKTLSIEDLNSRVVRDMAYNFNTSHFVVPALLESMFKYMTLQYNHITGDTVEKVLTCAYNLGYTPASLESLEYAAEIILRDFDQMSGLSVVQSCLALCYYKSIPDQLINLVFCTKFIQRIEEEIQICYSKATYPGLVLNRIMQLNRTVCLDFPEANVPWFQQNYVEAQLSKKSFKFSDFGTDIRLYLQGLLKDDKYFRCNHTTPYGYHIDFVIHFDKDKKPIPASPIEATMLDRITKVAILLLKLDSFCENDLSALRGPDSLKMKHLEMMGYKVLQINEHDWNSKHRMAPDAKANYLKCLLQIS